jgi:hypothetical protein
VLEGSPSAASRSINVALCSVELADCKRCLWFQRLVRSETVLEGCSLEVEIRYCSARERVGCQRGDDSALRPCRNSEEEEPACALKFLEIHKCRRPMVAMHSALRMGLENSRSLSLLVPGADASW